MYQATCDAISGYGPCTLVGRWFLKKIPPTIIGASQKHVGAAFSHSLAAVLLAPLLREEGLAAHKQPRYAPRDGQAVRRRRPQDLPHTNHALLRTRRPRALPHPMRGAKQAVHGPATVQGVSHPPRGQMCIASFRDGSSLLLNPMCLSCRFWLELWSFPPISLLQSRCFRPLR